MKRIDSILLAILLTVIAGCGGGGLITVDVAKDYPEKELIICNALRERGGEGCTLDATALQNIATMNKEYLYE